MRWSNALLVGVLIWVLIGTAVLGRGVFAAGPISEIEPNNSCFEAQDLGAISDTLTINGNLEGLGDGAYPYPAPDMAPNVDFFRFAVTPGSVIEIRLSAASSGLGTLENPLLGLFSSAADGCSQLETIDYGGAGLDAAIQYTVNSSELVIAATACCDYSFTNGGFGAGSYTLSVEVLQPAQSISGRVIDAETGEPLLRDFYGVSAIAELYRCDAGQCAYVAYAQLDSQSRFSFVHTDSYPGPGSEPAPPLSDNPSYVRLFAGEYQVRFYSQIYEAYTSEIVSIAAQEALDLGTIALTPIPLGASITGRLVDSITGEPLSGFAPTYATAYLNRCDEFGCFNYVSTGYIGFDGVFRFSNENIFDGLRVGDYTIGFYAEGYQFGATAPFTVAKNAEVILGDIAVDPNPIRFSAAQGCQILPSSGGTCTYAIDITSGQRSGVTYRVWSVINTFNFNSGLNSIFQPEIAKSLRLRPGETKTVEFNLDVPATVPNGTSFCASVYVAEQGRGFYFQPLAQSQSFCSVKDDTGYRQLSDDEARTMLHRIHGIRDSGRTRQ